ncbi:flavin reductase (NADPH)-like isoform X2 [Limulus polyphemus]|uniref:Flavin reductase (NADPH)-like isoform X2 n=1 Tax=Limulus polyphemus TaxID=6850 RepID=A0ABM1BS34_LIMPO|nr:flavin reductase (NADPH)-like isoform X2 [Limulus polyphemus]
MTPNIRKIVIFGATGNTGLATVQVALKLGFEVTAFLRDPSKLPPDVKPNKVIKGDVLNKDDVNKAVKGQDGVVIVLGTRNDLTFLFWEREKVPPRLVSLTEDHQRMMNVLKESDREWVALFPPHITNEPAAENYILKKDCSVGRVISKFDLGEILVKCLMMDDYIGHTVGMGYPQA